MALGKSPLEGLLMCMHYHIFIEDGDFEPSYVAPHKERLSEINCSSLGFYAILHMKDTSFAGQTHSHNLDKEGENRAQNKLPQFRVLWGSELVDWL